MTEPGAENPTGTPEADDSRPISVAELLARNGTIGAPPAGGRRRRRRGNSAAVTVAELTGEIPVIRDEIPPADETVEETVEETAAAEETAKASAEDTSDEVVEKAPADEDEAAEPEESAADETAEDETAEDETDEDETDEDETDEDETAEDETDDEAVASPPASEDPRPRRDSGPQLSHDPRPARRGIGAEEMAPDPVDQSVDLAGLVAAQDGDVEELRTYLKSSGGTLFGGQSMADDLARRGVDTDADGRDLPTIAGGVRPAPRLEGGRGAALRHAAIAFGQSALAVIFGAGLFIAFDQLWRWNNLVALVLSVLVILGLVVAVRVVRKTEDIASTLIAVAVGALVTLGPLALLQST